MPSKKKEDDGQVALQMEVPFSSGGTARDLHSARARVAISTPNLLSPTFTFCDAACRCWLPVCIGGDGDGVWPASVDLLRGWNSDDGLGAQDVDSAAQRSQEDCHLRQDFTVVIRSIHGRGLDPPGQQLYGERFKGALTCRIAWRSAGHGRTGLLIKCPAAVSLLGRDADKARRATLSPGLNVSHFTSNLGQSLSLLSRPVP